jgi:hypothetical protein
LQAKLLRVLNGEMQFRVGTEGNSNYGFVFRGLVALATWRDVDGQCDIREDLRQRISQHRIRVPGLSEYPSEVRLQIVVSVAEIVKNEIRDEIAHIDGLLAGGGNEEAGTVLASEWLQHANRSVDAKLPKSHGSMLADVDWSSCGQLRGLRATLRRVLCGGDINEALAQTQAAFAKSRRSTQPETSAERLSRYLICEASFSDAWLSDRHHWANEILQRLDLDDPEIHRVISESGQAEAEIKKDLRNLMRSGSKASES